MPLHPTLLDIALRLVLTVIAGGCVGLDRGVRGHVAGLRTTILVALAAAIAMIQANILLTVSGKTLASFGVMDLMRLPLGILTGVGFIGAGTILRRGDLVTGVTTAATLWVITVIGLCFGGGQILLGITGTVLTVLTLSCLRWLDMRIPREHRAIVILRTAADDNPDVRLQRLIAPHGFQAAFQRQSHKAAGEPAVFQFEILWKRKEIDGPPLDLVKLLNESFDVAGFEITAEPHN